MKKNLIKKLITGLTVSVLGIATVTACGSNAANVDSKTEENGSSNAADSSDASADENVEKITIYAATGGTPKPFTFVGDDGELTGHNIELIEAIFEKLPQYELEIEVTDFTSIFAGLDSDRYQIGVNNFAMNEERKEKYLYTDPIFANEFVAVFANGNEKAETIESWSDLGGLTTITQTGINVTTALENYNAANPDNPVSIEYSEEDLVLQLQDVEAGKYDFVLIDKPMFEYYQKEFSFNLTGVSISSDVASDLMQEPYSYILVSAGNEQLVEDINAALKEVIEDGTSKEINEKWFGSDYSPSYN